MSNVRLLPELLEEEGRRGVGGAVASGAIASYIAIAYGAPVRPEPSRRPLELAEMGLRIILHINAIHECRAFEDHGRHLL